MKYIKSSFLFAVLVLTTFTISSNVFTNLFNKYASAALIRSLSLRYQIFLKTKELNRLEKNYKRSLSKELEKTDYPTLGNKAYKLFKKNYILQEELGGLNIYHIFSKLFHGSEFMKKHQNDLAIYNKLCDERNKIFGKTYREIYTKEYYEKRNTLRGTRRLLNEDIPLKWLQKPMG